MPNRRNHFCRAALASVALGVAVSVALGVVSGSARGETKHPIEHEPILPDPANDVAFGLRLDGDLPAAIDTRSGVVAAPDPRAALPAKPVNENDRPTSLAGHDEGGYGTSRFVPDTDTRRPGTLPYSDPFVPSTTPWKRLVAFDDVDADFGLRVYNEKTEMIPLHEVVRTDGSEEQFYGDLVVDLRANELTRIPSVGPGARVVHARLGVGAEDLDFEMVRDGADNWFIRSKKGGRARLVFELTVARAVFGGPLGDSFDDGRADRATVALAPRVQRDADVVAARIGVPKATRRETIEALVDYFRGFTESNDPPSREKGVYLALALSRKGVCRHRAYAFMVTAAGLGIRSRVVLNEAHAWVEVTDGRIWKRVDLGGAGMILDRSEASPGPAYAPPPDPFRWPANAKRGEDLARTARGPGGAGGAGEAGAIGRGGGANDPSDQASYPTSRAGSLDVADDASGSGFGSGPFAHEDARDPRPRPEITVEAGEASTPRGEPVHVRGEIMAEGSPCAHVRVVISVAGRKTGSMTSIGELATNERGAYFGVVVVPRSVLVGDYELVASTPGNDKCRAGVSP